MKNITLKEVLNKNSVHVLKYIASAFKVKGYTKMKKGELIDACAEILQKEGVLSEHIFILPHEAWEFYKKVAKSKDGLICNVEPIKYVISEKLGFLYAEKCEGGYWFAIPNEIKKTYNNLIKSGISDAKDFTDLINQYAQAAVNLYGAISQEELVEIFNSQNEQQTNIDLNFEIYMRHVYLNCNYCLWEEYVVHEDLEENDFESVKYLIRDTANKPRYIPDKEEFLLYADQNYYENTKQLIDLSKFLINKCCVSENVINKLMFDLHWKFADECSLQNFFDVLEQYNVIIEEKHLDELVRLIMECCNNTRIWTNKGYTPNELAKLYRTPQAKSQKVGRNEPCPCGSGKKYKKCCGR